MYRPRRSAVDLVLVSLLFLSCGGGGGSSFDPEKSPYGERTPTTRTSSTLSFPAGAVVTGTDLVQTSTVVGQITIGGQTFDRVASTSVADPTQGGEYWVKHNSDGTQDFAGFEMHSAVAAQVVPQGTVVFDAPIKVKTDAPVGQPQAVTLSAKFTPAGSAQALPVSATGQYTLAEKDVVAQTNMGPLSGCDHYTGSLSTASTLIPASFQGMLIAGEAWVHPSFGVVAFNAPGLGIQSKMNGSDDCGPVDSSGHRTIRKVGIVSNATGKFELSSYECVGDLEADKTVHAKMLLELRWLDEAMAKTDVQPTNKYQFEALWGTFPSKLGKSELSIFHPEENGKGFKYWYAFVDQAAKNEPGTNGITYGVVVSPLTDSAVRASARIYYKVYPWPQATVDGGSVIAPLADASISKDVARSDLPMADAPSTSATAEVGPGRDSAPVGDVVSPRDAIPAIDVGLSRDVGPTVDAGAPPAVDAGPSRG